MGERTVVIELQDILTDLEAQERRARETLAKVEDERKAIQLALRIYQERNGGAALNNGLIDLRGLPQMEALDAIADANGGVIRVTEARDHMITAGFFANSKNPRKNALPQIRSILDRSPRHERTGKGVYQRISRAAPAEGVILAA